MCKHILCKFEYVLRDVVINQVRTSRWKGASEFVFQKMQRKMRIEQWKVPDAKKLN